MLSKNGSFTIHPMKIFAFGRRIKAARVMKGVTQSHLASLLGVNQVTLRNYELGRTQPSAEMIYLLKNHLGVSYEWLLEGPE